MAIDFPNSPTSGQIFTSGDKSWIWDGTVWKAYGASLSPTVLKVDSTNTRVGINNQSPAYTLDVNGTVEATQFIQGTDYLTPYTGFRNAIINGDFRINQRSFTSTTTNATYGFDRWYLEYSGGTSTYSSQSFTVGSPAVTGYEAATFARIVSASQTLTSHYTMLVQRIEDVRTFANAPVTISFWAKASAGTPSVAIELQQNFGSGGTPSAQVNNAVGKVTLSTSWTRYTLSYSNVPSISGKTIGTTANTSFIGLNIWTSAGSDYNTRTGTLGLQSATIDFWGVQVERGSVATPFEQRPIQTELALCQRYYFQSTTTLPLSMPLVAIGATNVNYCTFSFPVQMRSAPNVAVSSVVAEGHHTNLPTITSSSAHLVGFEYSGGNTRSPGIRLNIGLLTAEKEF